MREDSIIDQLLEETEVMYWTCGSRVEQSSVEKTFDHLLSLIGEKHSAIQELEDEITDIKSEQD